MWWVGLHRGDREDLLSAPQDMGWLHSGVGWSGEGVTGFAVLACGIVNVSVEGDSPGSAGMVRPPVRGAAEEEVRVIRPEG